MIHYEYHIKAKSVVINAKAQYPWLSTMSLADESIEARYHLLWYLQDTYWYHWILDKDIYNKPIPIEFNGWLLFWSIAHTENYIACIISDDRVGIDIAEIKFRNSALLMIFPEYEYILIGERNWETFYILWTSKEALIKKIYWKIEDMGEMYVQSYTDNRMIISFYQKEYTIYCIEWGTATLAYC